MPNKDDRLVCPDGSSFLVIATHPRAARRGEAVTAIDQHGCAWLLTAEDLKQIQAEVVAVGDAAA